MSWFLFAYFAGIVINGAVAALVWRDLVADDMLADARKGVIVLFVLLSFLTWIYILIYVVISVLKNLRPKK